MLQLVHFKAYKTFQTLACKIRYTQKNSSLGLLPKGQIVPPQ